MEDPFRAKRYHQTRRILGLLSFLLDVSVLVFLLFTGLTVALRATAESLAASPPLALIVYIGIFGFITKAVGLPLDFARGYWLEWRYSLSNQTLTAWVKDQVKGFLVGAVLAMVGVQCLYVTMRRWPDYWWMIAASVFVAFFVLMTNLAPVLIFPIFFKFRPLENPLLTQRLVELARRAGANVQGVFEWKLSEKSKKANAALVGLGNTRRIIVADTLLAHFNDDEVESVLAHELGHHVHRHILRGLLLQSTATYLGFFLADIVLRRFSDRFGFRSLSDFANLPLLLLVATGLSLILLPVVNAHARAMERQADAYALHAIPSASAFSSGMEKLAELNLAERQPPAWIEWLFHSHPSVEKRLAFARRFSATYNEPGEVMKPTS